MNLPRKVGKARVYLSHARTQLLAANYGARGVIVDFLAYSGLRWGEVAELRGGDLDTVRRRVSVQRNAVMVGGDGTTHIRPPDPRNGWWVRAIAACREVDPDFPASLTRHDLRHTAAASQSLPAPKSKRSKECWGTHPRQ